jgi:hypothetical protein
VVFLLTHGTEGGYFTVVQERTNDKVFAKPDNPIVYMHKSELWNSLAKIDFLKNAVTIYVMEASKNH